ncbi:Uncharacterised protein [Vibrio cholerae]|nr:Uncharacterised protein [Vibrio cholerae]CSI73503.1 Uncharacterised protein [Vibrio cholerae]
MGYRPQLQWQRYWLQAMRALKYSGLYLVFACHR